MSSLKSHGKHAAPAQKESFEETSALQEGQEASEERPDIDLDGAGDAPGEAALSAAAHARVAGSVQAPDSSDEDEAQQAPTAGDASDKPGDDGDDAEEADASAESVVEGPESAAGRVSESEDADEGEQPEEPKNASTSGDSDATVQIAAVEEAGDDAADVEDETLFDAQQTVAIPFVAPGDAAAGFGQAAPPAYAPEANGQATPGFVSAGFESMPSQKRRGAGAKVAAITLGVIVAVILVVYAAGAFVFMGRFMPNTTIAGKDLSMKTDQEATEILQSIADGYQIDIVGGAFSYRATGDDLRLSVNPEKAIKAMHEDQNPWQWPMLLMQSKHDESAKLNVTFERSAYEPQVVAAVEAYNATAQPSADASIVFNQAANKFEVKPEVQGTQLSMDSVLASIADAIGKLDSKVVLDDSNYIHPAVVASDPRLAEAAQTATKMASARLTLTMAGQTVAEVNGITISPYITINEKYEVTFNEDALRDWAYDLANKLDTVKTERTYTRADGKQVAVPAGGVYGWVTDGDELMAQIMDGVKNGTVATIEVPCSQTADAYNGPNQRDWGPRYIDVDLSEQYVRFYGDDGAIIWESACISGTPDGEHNTVPGMWYVNNKESPSKLIGYENGKKIYETTVQYWMAFEYNGIGFHDATWQPSFGGSMYANGYGSHGCVNLPYGAAEELYGIVRVGDVVAVHF